MNNIYRIRFLIVCLGICTQQTVHNMDLPASYFVPPAEFVLPFDFPIDDPIYFFLDKAADGELETLKKFPADELDTFIKKGGHYALKMAAHFGRLSVVVFLLNKGVNVNSEFPLEAAIHGHDESQGKDNLLMIQTLIEHKAEVTDYAKRLMRVPGKSAVKKYFETVNS